MKAAQFIRGCIAPCYTCWKEDESFDERAQRNLFDFMLQSGAVTSYFVRSGMGQMYAYGYEDVKAVARCACEHLKGAAPVLVNCSGIWDGLRDAPERPDPEVYTRQAVDLSRYAAERGADAVVHVIPEALIPYDGAADQDSIYTSYYETVCAAVDLPVVIYHPRVQHAFTPELLGRLADIPNLLGMKISSVDGYFVYELLRATRGKDFHVIQGAEMLYYAALYAGSRAVIGAGCNLYPQILKAELERFEAGDHAGVLAAQDSVNTLYSKCPSSSLVMKRLATEAGCPVGMTARRRGKGVYGKVRHSLDEDAFQAYKRLREEVLARYT